MEYFLRVLAYSHTHILPKGYDIGGVSFTLRRFSSELDLQTNDTRHELLTLTLSLSFRPAVMSSVRLDDVLTLVGDEGWLVNDPEAYSKDGGC